MAGWPGWEIDPKGGPDAVAWVKLDFFIDAFAAEFQARK
jgi:hypothetical protein